MNEHSIFAETSKPNKKILRNRNNKRTRKSNKHFWVFLTVFLFHLSLVLSISAQKADKIDKFLEAERVKRNIPGMSVAIVRNGKIIKSKGYGLANIELKVPASPDTVYKIASISKPIIAVAIMKLVEEGKLGLDDPVSKYLEETPKTWKDITIRHFLSHTSGVVRESPAFDGNKILSDAEVIKAAYPLPLRFKTGEKYEYCNVGYFSLAEIIKKVSGKSWDIYFNEHIFQPLGMTNTRTTIFDEIISNRANAYSFRNEKLFNESQYIALRPSGAFISTVSDLAKFSNALYSDDFLKPESRNLMWTPFKLNDGKDSSYGLGWQINNKNNVKIIQHGGSLNGFRTEFTHFPNEKLTIIILTNLAQANPAEISLGVAKFYIQSLEESVKP